ncbi:MAG TPA: aminotransferase class V-fold PLP-dependent enzyme [Chitinophagaceae bacterium]|nr:aminotransferase class V-fold PLP-dependent enzyme [Chitinophagaceae bacterium]
MQSIEWVSQWHQFLESHPSLKIPSTNLSLPSFPESIEDKVRDENYWAKIQALYPKPENHINLNNGGVCSNSLLVERAYLTYYSLLNTSPSYFTWKVMEAGRDIIKQGLALMCNASSNEIALFRNATEALNNAIFGIPLNEGDEVVACHQDYIKCVSSWKQREDREKIKISWVEINGHETDDEVIKKYVDAFSPKTKVLHLTHVINWNGQILPVVQIANEAKKRGIIVLLDAAHSFAILETDVQKIDCDYMAVALHKWLSGPIAGGMLYIKKDRIASTYPLASSVTPLSDSIKKFEEMSIQVLPNLLALGYAIELQLKLSRQLKEARLVYLRERWTSQLISIPKIKFNINTLSNQCKAIANFQIDGEDPLNLEKILFDQFKIHVVGFNWPNLSGIRITPNINTKLDEIDTFVRAIKVITNSN